MIDDHHAVYQALLRATEAGEPVVLVTVIATQGSMPRHAGSKMLVRASGAVVGTVGGGAMEARAVDEALAVLHHAQPCIQTYTLNSLDDGDPGVCGGSAQLFFEPVQPAPALLVVGGGHVGKALAELGKWSGYRVTLCDDRPDFCNPEYAPGLDAYLVCKPGEIAQRMVVDTHTYVAAVTRGMPVDLDLIPALLATPAPYIGLIGSRRRWMLTVKALKERYNLDDDALSRVQAPIGLELRAETPKEIAISIMAEIIMRRRGGTGQPMAYQPQ